MMATAQPCLFELPAPTTRVNKPVNSPSVSLPAPAGSRQGELDLAGLELEAIWSRRVLESAAARTEETRCLQWLNDNARLDEGDWAWWRSLPSYERGMWLCDYRHMRERIEAGLPFRPAALYRADREAAWVQTKALARLWSGDIRKAFKEGRPCPILPTPRFEIALDMAISLAGVPKACVERPSPDDEEDV
jgi:hypothetical protein